MLGSFADVVHVLLGCPTNCLHQMTDRPKRRNKQLATGRPLVTRHADAGEIKGRVTFDVGLQRFIEPVNVVELGGRGDIDNLKQILCVE